MLQNLTDHRYPDVRPNHRKDFNVGAESQAEEAWRKGFSMRLRALMLIHDRRVKEMADGIGVSVPRFSNWLQEIACPPVYYVHLLQKRFGMSSDYLLSEVMDNLPDKHKTLLAHGPRAYILKHHPAQLRLHEQGRYADDPERAKSRG